MMIQLNNVLRVSLLKIQKQKILVEILEVILEVILEEILKFQQIAAHQPL